jgi:ribokinase
MAKQSGVPVILNPAPARELPDSLLRNVSILTPNETEVELLTGLRVDGVESAGKAADQLLARGVGTVIITLGAKGAYIVSAAARGLVPGFAVKAVDTTAAGDTFNGALAVALAGGRPFDHAVRFAHAAAAISVTRLGAQPSAPTRAEIEELLARS